jgi:hypothetical protein
MKAKTMIDLPIPQSGCGNTELISDGISLTLRFEYRKSKNDHIGIIKFDGVIAHRFRDEVHSLGYASEAYESIAEILDSTWCSELNFDGRHFAIFRSSNGYFEVWREITSWGIRRRAGWVDN